MWGAPVAVEVSVVIPVEVELAVARCGCSYVRLRVSLGRFVHVGSFARSCTVRYT